MKTKTALLLSIYVCLMVLLVPSVSASSLPSMQGEAVPSGTVVTGESYSGSPATNAIDGDLTTYWNSGSSSGTIQLNFTSPTPISGVQIAANAFPETSEVYTIYGLSNDKWTRISPPTTLSVKWNSQYKPTILDPISVTPGFYSGIKIQVNAAGYSWVAISEISILRANICSGLDGEMPPKGTTITGTSYPGTEAVNAIDCNLLSYWNSGSSNGMLQLNFPSATAVSSINIAANAYPETDVVYTIYGLLHGSWNQISTSTRYFVNWSPQYNPTLLTPISVTPDYYDGLRIQVNATGTSWAAISEITLSSSLVTGLPSDSKANIIPPMSSNNFPSGLVESSNANLGDGYQAFDRQDNTQGWTPNSVQNQWLSYKFASPVVLVKYTIKPVNHTVGPSRAPKNWKFEGYDGTKWVTLDTRTGITDWKATVAKDFSFVNNTAYDKYRIFVNDNNGDPQYLTIGEMEMMGFDLNIVKNLVATPGDHSITLSWNPLNTATGYNIYQDGVKINQSSVTTNTYKITGLTNSNTYHLGVSALLLSGESATTLVIGIPTPSDFNIIPKMSSNTSPSGLVEFSNAYYGDGYQAFDRQDNTQGWTPNSVQNQWLSYKFSSPKTIVRYTIKPVNHVVGPSRAPKDWKLEGYDGTKWVTLDARTGIIDWQATLAKEFTFTNSTAYDKYRLFVNNNNGDPQYLTIGEMEMIEKN
ncbi:hypothetical protein GK047_26545 [Paenibacillus sp. SYP-B3998]|uniref:Fibronectin type-III domain-containing protein n=1 Tax=Paenibacillus sp. SYP-B3998 TaxID=2678564 RepID=A0A6G4A597_9BACL|nr:discoidin domain-containing protein [Paenibacillus sp. SYP-B3998]NEW09500.1 hypothetical protein [Paenibacillus sp. SYP-B3998]